MGLALAALSRFSAFGPAMTMRLSYEHFSESYPSLVMSIELDRRWR